MVMLLPLNQCYAYIFRPFCYPSPDRSWLRYHALLCICVIKCNLFFAAGQTGQRKTQIGSCERVTLVVVDQNNERFINDLYFYNQVSLEKLITEPSGSSAGT